ncbi:hypothetical protein [Holospora curviuscula]|uniref:Uncharacterized protein n=1 Tax=Holospora curviuscula TaxID=1082868 RepID=A0A2S5R946_9PROT|nr:hypothetical protein [Holospora curviuscula]PPE03851.1 hypothetical protein HCUR_00628 [Holospora curviuscula]
MFFAQVPRNALAQGNNEQDNNVQNLLVQQRIEFHKYKQAQENIRFILNQFKKKNIEIKKAEQAYKDNQQSIPKRYIRGNARGRLCTIKIRVLIYE